MNIRHLALVVCVGVLVAACGTPEPTTLPADAEPTIAVPTAINLNVTPWAPITPSSALTTTGQLTSTAGLTVTEGITPTGVLTPTIPVTFAVPADTLGALQNLAYTVNPDAADRSTYPLVNGSYFNTDEFTSVVLVPPAATGDLDADGVTDAVTILAVNTGGSGVFEYLAAVVDEAGQMVNVDSVFLGDRIRIDALDVADGQITLEVVRHGPSDPQCCPTQRETWAFRLVDGTLTVVSERGPQPSMP